MTKKILVGYSTWSGTTHEIANYIGDQLSAQDFQVDIHDLKTKFDPSLYDAFILGTSIHASNPIRSFKKFLKKNFTVLQSKPTAFFVVCANMYEDTPENREETLSWLTKAISSVPTIPVIDTGLFGGAILTSGPDFDKLPFFTKSIIKTMQTSTIDKVGKDDFRDWDKIKDWTIKISKSL